MLRSSITGVFLASLLLIQGCSTTDSTLTEPAEAFLQAIEEGDVAHAHRYLSKSLGSRTSVEGLSAFMRHTGLSQPGERRWQQSSIDGDFGIINGEVEVKGEAQPLPVRLTFRKENLNWKVDGLARGVRVASQNGEQILYAPTDKHSNTLALQTTSRFAEAVAGNDLRGYWSTMADAFRTKFSDDQFNQAFAGFVRDKVNLRAAAKLPPQLTAPPTLEANGELVMQGVYPTQPSQIAFEYRYIKEGDDWINSGITLNLVPRS